MKLKFLLNLFLFILTANVLFAAAPTITNFSPATGPVGTLVTITGTNLTSPTALTIGGQTAIVVSNTGSVLVAMVMPNATTGGVSITTAGGTATGAGNFTVTPTLYPLAQQGGKIVGTGGVNPHQGSAVAISADGNTAIVGGYNDNSNQGAVWIYTRSGGAWAQQGSKLVGTGVAGVGNQGWSVALSADGNTAIVGGQRDNFNQGAAWIFIRNGTTWSQQGTKLVGTGNTGAALQGSSVSLSADGNTAIIGGSADNTNIGAAWIFKRSGATWAQQGSKLVGSDYSGAPQQGIAVSMSADGNTAMVGGSIDNSSMGAAWVYVLNGSNWVQQGSKLVGSGTYNNFSLQGASVSLSADGNTAIVGGNGDNWRAGAAWVYTRSGTTWTQQGSKLLAKDGVGTGPEFGFSVSISADGNTAILGGYYDNTDIGASWVFTRQSGVWAQKGAKLIGTNSVGLPDQGYVALSADGSTAIVGAPNDNTAQGAVWFNVPLVAPTVAANHVAFASTTATSTTASWSVGNGTARVVFMAPATVSSNPTPVDLSTYTANPIYGTGAEINGSGWFCIYNGTGASVNITGLTGGVSYKVIVIDYNGINGNFSYSTSSGVNNPAVVTTLTPPAPTISGFSPATGSVGTMVTINGANLTAPTALKIGGQSAIVISNTGTKIVAMVMPGAATGAITFTTAGGTATASGNYTVTPTLYPSAQQGAKLVGTGNVNTVFDYQGCSVAVSADGNTAAVGAYGENNNQGAIWIYTRTGSTWTQQGTKLAGTGVVSNGYQGFSVAISADGNTVLAGGKTDNSGVIAASVFTRSGSTWTQQGTNLVCTGAKNMLPQGTSVALSADGNTAIIGGPGDDSNKGAAWVFTRGGVSWSQQGVKLTGTGAVGTYIYQGFSVAMSGDGNTAIVGGYGDDNDRGAAWVYVRSGNTFTQQGAKLVDPTTYGSQGTSVSLSADGNTAMLGSGNNNGAWMYVRSSGVWAQQGPNLVGIGVVGYADQGSSVSLSADGNTGIVGGYSDNNSAGAAWVFTRNGNTWTQQGNKLVGSGGVGGSYLGSSVSLSADGTTAFSGGYFDNSYQGAAWVFAYTPPPTITSISPASGPVGTLVTINGTNLNTAPNTVNIGGQPAIVISNTGTVLVAMVMPNATTGAVVTGSNSGSATAGSNFTVTSTLFPSAQQGSKLVGTGNTGAALQGSSVAVSADGNTAIVGAPIDNSSQGAAWIYIWNGTSWVQQGAKLVGTGSIGAARQGYSVGISANGNTVILGGYNDNGGIGAAWIFTRSGSAWTQQQKLIGSILIGNSRQGWSVALSADGNTAIVGAPGDNSNVGSAWIFERSGITWSPFSKMVGNDNIGAAQMGTSVAISADGNTTMMGGITDNASQGAAWAYYRIGSYFYQRGNKLVGFDNSGLSKQGSSVALNADGTTAIVGGIGDNGSIGAAWVFTYNASTTAWAQQGSKLVGTGNVGASGQGQSVSLSADGNTAIVGGPQDDTNQGASWVYTRSGSTWAQQGNKLIGTGNTGAGTQGQSVTLSAGGATALVGAPLDNSSQGAAWTFVYSPPPTLTSFNPANGPVGTLVTINGTNLNTLTNVTIGGQNAIIISNTGTVAVAMVMPNATTGTVVLTSNSGSAISTSNFTVTPTLYPTGQQGAKLVGTGSVGSPVYQGNSVAVSADGNTAVVGGPRDNNSIGAIWVYTRTGGVWSQQGTKLIGTGYTGSTPRQGYSVAIGADGNTIIEGGYEDNSAIGAAWVFTRSGTTWIQQGTKLVPTGNTGTAFFGGSIAISADGNTAAIGGFGDNTGQGAVWVFSRNSGVWTQQGSKLIGTNYVGVANQGTAIAISADGNTVLDGGPIDNANQGAAWVFIRNGSTWSQQGAKLVGTGYVGKSSQGQSVALSADGNTAIVGGWSDNGTQGAAWVFTRSGPAWSQQGAKLVGTGSIGAWVYQGWSVSLSADGNSAIIGGTGDNTNIGAAWIFARNGTTWSQQGSKMVGSGYTGSSVGLGTSVAMSADGTTAFVGGVSDNTNVGAAWAYVYIPPPTIISISPASGPVGTLVTINGTNLNNPTALTIGGQTAIVISNTGTKIVAMVMPNATTGTVSITAAGATATSSDSFTVAPTPFPLLQQGAKLVGTGNVGVAAQGLSVAVSADGNTAIVGAPQDNSNTGAAWIYVRNGGAWTQQSGKLVASGTTTFSELGYSVAISADGNTAIVGAFGDNGGQGATLVFTRSGTTWAQQGPKLIGTGNTGAAHQGIAVSVSADGNTALIGGSYDNTQIGATWVFTRSGSTWTQQGAKLVGTGNTGASGQGQSVCISADGNTAIIGGPGDNNNGGASWIFTRSGTTWSQQAKLFGTGVYGFSSQGQAVALSADGNTAIVGGGNDNNYIGATWVFTRSGNTWSQQGNKLVGAGGNSYQGQSLSLSADGNTAIIGSLYDASNLGAAWIFTRTGGMWAQQGSKFTGTGAIGNSFQGAVSLSADGATAFIGGQGDNTNIGAAWAYTVLTAPTAQATNVTFSATTDTKTTVNCTVGNGTSRAIFMAPATISGLASPVDLTAYNANAVYTTGDEIGTSGWYCVYNGTGTNVTVTGLTGGVAYQVMAIEYNGTGQNVKYLTTAATGNPATVTTLTPQLPTITNFSPASGPIGTLITISGTNLNQPTAFSIGGQTAIVVSNTGTQLVSMIMPNATTGNISLTTAGGTAVGSGNFTVTPTPVPSTQQGTKLVGTGGLTTPRQGYSVDISADGNTAIVGGPYDNSNQGAAWIYVRNGGVWSQQGAKLLGTGVVSYALQGVSVAISADGNTAAVGGPTDNQAQGAVWVFTRSGTIWTQQGTKLIGTGSIGAAQQGNSISISADGNTIVFGAPYDNGYIGAAWVFSRGGTTWSQQGNKLVGTGNVGNSYQGTSVKISSDGNTILVGGPYDNATKGAVWVYARNGNAWTQQGAKLTGTGTVANSEQGQSLSISADGNTALIGAPSDNNTLGAAWVFIRSGSNWSQQGTKLIGTGGIGSSWEQGNSVSLSADGNTAIIGGSADNNNIGATWVFARSGSTWTQQGSKLVGTGSTGNAQQGYNVAVSSDGATAFVGGYADNSNAGAAWAYYAIVAPTVQATNVTFTNTALTTTTASWTNGNGTLRAVFIAATNTGSPSPADLTAYTANPVFGSGSQIGSTGWYCIYNGNGTTVNITGLTAGTTYQVMVVEYNGTGNTIKYLTATATANPATLTTHNPYDANGILYVNQAIATGDGSSWALPVKEFRDALTIAAANPGVKQIWVAKGTYLPTSTSDRTKSFDISGGVPIYGGFKGNETSIASRVIASNPAVLSGDIGVTGNNTDNVYRVVVMHDNALPIVLDGFTITGSNNNVATGFLPLGNASYGLTAGYGGGLTVYEPANQITVNKLTITGNSALNGTGAYFGAINNSGPNLVTVNNCIISNNTSMGGAAGGMYISGLGTAVLNGCVFDSNVSTSSDHTSGSGGGLQLVSGTTVTCNNCLFNNNQAAGTQDDGGGAVMNYGGTLNLVNSTLYNNTTASTVRPNANGVSSLSQTTSAVTNIVNTIIWSSKAINLSNVQSTYGLTVTYKNSLIKGSGLTSPNLDTDPLFVNAANPIGADGIWGTADDGLQIACASPARAAGNTASGTTTDIIGTSRGATPDMGAYQQTGAGIVPSASIAITSGSPCAKTAITFTASVVNCGSVPTYQWLVNSVATGTNSATFTSNTLNASDTVVCKITPDNSICVTLAKVSSNAIIINSLPVITTASINTVNVGAAYTPLQLTAIGGSGTYAYAISTGSLPSGITLTSAGVLSGTSVVPGTYHFTVKATESGCSNTTTKAFTADINGLSSLLTSAGVVSPAFTADVTSYTLSVPYTTTGITITPTAGNDLSTITVNGAAVGSGIASGQINLNEGSNTISITLTAHDGITAKTYTISVTRNVPAIAATDAPTALTTVYGTASSSSVFHISGTNMTAGILVTPPTGYEVSTNNTSFTNTVTAGSAGTIASTPVYIRLKATAPVGTYPGNIVLSSNGATDVNVATTPGTVTGAPITIAANNVSKPYGTAITGGAGSTAYTLTAGTLKNGNILSSVTIAYGTGSAASDPVATNTGTVTPSAATGANGFDANNYIITYTNGNIIVTKATLTVTATAANKTYDSNTSATVTLSDNRSSGDVFTINYTAAFTNKNVGTGKTVNITGISISGGASANYTLNNTTASTTANITIATATVTAQTDTRVYNKTTASAVAPTVSGIMSGDAVTTNPVQTFNNANVGTGKTLTASGLVINDGNGGNNYSINYVINTTGVITQATATVTAKTDTKVYDKTTTSAQVPTVTGLVSGDVASTAPTQTFDNSNTGTGKTLTASGLVINDGNGGNNYSISYVTNTTGVISKATATVTAKTDTKVYDRTTTSAQVPTVTGLLSGDAITTAPTQAYNNSNVGTGKTLTATGLVINDGNSGNNYNISYVTNTTGVITKATATVTAQADTKVYDKTTTSATTPLVTGLLSGDAITTAPTQAYNNANVGTGKTLTPSGLVINDGNSGGNYSISYITNTTGVITKASVTVSAKTDSKVYDKTTTSTQLPTVTGLVSGDIASTNPTQTFNTVDIGTGKTLTAAGLVINDGNGGNNYSISYVTNTTGVISKASATVTVKTDTKVYDRTTTSAQVPTVTGLLSGDAITTAPTQAYNNANVGTGKTLTATGLVINDGNSGNNYNISYVTNTTGVITKATATVTAQADTKVYDKTMTSAVVPTVTGLLSGDAITTAPTQAYNNANVGTGKTLTPSGLVINDGNSGGNYSINYITNATGVITKASVTVTAKADTKVYDKTTTSTQVPTVTGLVNGDVASTNPTQIFDTKNVATGKTLTPSGLVINDGNSGSNYAVSYVNNNTGVITVATVTVTAKTDSKVYDKTTTSTQVPTVTGLVSGDVASTNPTQTFNTADIGTGKTLTPAGLVINDGNSGNNYSISYVANNTGVISKATITVTAQADTKIYDRTLTSAQVPTVTGLLSGDAITTAPTQAYNNANVGTGKTLTASGLVVNDGNGGSNYTINYVANTTGVITKASVTVTAQTDSKVYNKTTASAIVPVVSGLISGDVASVNPIQTYNNSNVGTGKTLIPSGLVVSDGNSGNNYNISYVNNTTGIITAAALTVTAKSDTKVYDKTTASALAPIVSGLVSGDVVITNPTQTYNNSNVGTGKTLTASGLIVNDGNSGNNYSISYISNTNGQITPATVTVTAKTDTKVYDKSTVSTVVPTVGGFIAGDIVSTAPTQVFDNSNVGTGKTLIPSGLVINDGNSGNNYTINYINNNTGVITAATLTYTATAASREYGEANPAFTGTITGFVGTDTQASAVTGALSFSSTATAATVVGKYAIMGAGLSAANYLFVQAAANNTALTITKVALTVKANDASKTAGTKLTGGSGSTEFTSTGLKNSETIGSVTITYGAGAAISDPAGTYTGSVVASAATGGNFNSANYIISYLPGDIIVTGVIEPVISSTDAPTALTTVYGTASSSSIFHISGTNMTAGILVTPPTGYEVSTNNTSFTNTVTAGSAGTIASTPVYIRLKATAPVGTYPGNIVLSSTGAADVNVATTPGTVTGAPITIAANNVSKPYGTAITGGAGSTAYTLTAGTLKNGNTLSSVTIAYGTGSAASDPVATNTGTVTPSAATGANGFDANNYIITYTKGNIIVTKATLTVTATAANKTYDGNTSATVTLSDNRSSGDVFTVNYTAAFTNKNVGTGKIVNITGISISGGASANYTLNNTTASTTANITIATATVTAQTDTRVYNKTTASAVAPTVSGIMSGDAVTINPVQTFNNANVGTGKTLTASGLVINDGNGGNNYSINYVINTTGVITQATATVTAKTDTKVYDKTTTSAQVPTVTGLLSGDAITTAPTQAYNNANVGTGKTLTATGLVINDGNSGNNYNISYVTNTTGVITKATATVTAQADTKVYDKTTTSATTPLVTGLLSGDAITTAPTQAYNNANVGTGKTLTPSGLVINDGNSGGNYSISYITNTTGVITKASVTVTAKTDTKVYDKTTTSTQLPTVTGLVSGDVASINPTQIFDTKNVGTGKTLTASGLVINDGNSGNNYTINYVNNNTGVITVATVTVTAKTDSKVYDKTTTSTQIPTVTGLVSGDVASTNPTQTFNTADIGTGKTLTAAGLVINDGNGGNNYSISYVANNTGVISKATITVTAQADTKVYDKTTTSVATPIVTGLLSGDAITTAPTQTFNNANVGTGKTLTASGLVVNDGNGGSNYTINYVANTTGVISKATATVTAKTDTKVYDRTTVSTLIPAVTGLVSGDVASTNPTQTFNNANAGTGKILTATGLVINDGNGGGNYNINYVVNNTGVISAKAINVTAQTDSRVYNGTNSSSVAPITSALITGDAIAIAPTQTFDSKNVGTGKVLTPAGLVINDGNSGNNYSITYVPKSTGVITAATLTYTATASSRAYGAANPTFTGSVSGFVGGDTQASATTGSLVFTTAATVTSPVGSYAINGSGLSAANYVFTQAAANSTALTIGRGALTITANGTSKIYGDANPALTVTYSGFVGSDNATNLTTQPTIATTATISSGAGVYPITASGAVSSNYNITYVAGSLTINRAGLTVIANNANKTYGTANPALTVTYSGFVGADDANSLITKPTVNTTATTMSPVGTYTVTASGAASNNYNINYVNGTLTVDPATLVITANNASRVYGSANPGFTVSYTGFAGTDNPASLTTAPTVNTTATIASAVGTYPITAGGASSSNYSISYVSGTLTVTPATLTITANNQTKVYGSANPVLTVSYSGFVNGDTQSTLTTMPTASTTAITASAVGTYPITASGGVSSNYNINYVSGTLTVTKAALTLTVNNQSRVYGAANPALTVTYSGFVNGDTQSSLTTAPAVTTTATTASAVGTYPITASGAASSNYSIIYISGTLTVTQATLTITATNQTKVYGAANPVLTVSYTGFVNGDTQNSITTAATVSTVVNTATAVGNYPITASGASAANYAITYLPGTFAVTKATLTVTADNQTKVYGTPNPPLTISYSGFVNGDAAAQLTIQPIGATTATNTSNVGNYAITVSGGSSANYSFNYINGNLNVTPATRILTFTALAGKTYGNADFDPGATISTGEVIQYSSLNTAVATIVNGKIHIVGAGTTIIVAMVPVNANYLTAPTASSNLLVSKANQDVSFSLPAFGLKGSSVFLYAMATSGLPVVITSSDPSIAYVSAQSLVLSRLGNVKVTVSQPGDNNYLPASSVEKTITVDDDQHDEIIFHQAVTPNGDGNNDFLLIEGVEKYPVNHLVIANRNGVKIFETSGYDNMRNTFKGLSNNGLLQPQGTYFYLFEYTVNGEKQQQKGFLVLKY